MRTRSSIRRDTRQQGFVLIFVAAAIGVLFLFGAFALDLGRAYAVRATLSKALDGAALAAARKIDQGYAVAKAEFDKIFMANFPPGTLGASVTHDMPPPTRAADGSFLITGTASATVSTTVGRLAGVPQIAVASTSQSTRRLVDMALVIDRSGSLGNQWPQVQDAASHFVSQFDENNDRVALIVFSANTIVADPINVGARGFNKGSILSHIAAADKGGNTATAEALYQAWDQLRMVPAGQQAGVRVIVLFTDGAPNAFPGRFQVGSDPTLHEGTLATGDFPGVAGTTSSNTPTVSGLFQTSGTVGQLASNPPWVTGYGNLSSPCCFGAPYTQLNPSIKNLPTNSYHYDHHSAGIPDNFPLYDPALGGQRKLKNDGSSPYLYADHVFNANNAARNLAESVANAARGDMSGNPILVLTLGLGDLLLKNQGTVPETGQSLLQRVANESDSPDAVSTQAYGHFFFAQTADDLDTAFQSVRNEIIRLTQ